MNNTSTWFDDDSPLSRKFVLYLPSKDRSGVPIEGLDRVIHSTTAMLCERFGGVTSFPATGRFARSAGNPETEEILVLESFCDNESWSMHADYLRVWVAVMAAQLRQESIACALDGRMVFVNPPSQPEGPEESEEPDTLPRLVARILNLRPRIPPAPFIGGVSHGDKVCGQNLLALPTPST